MKEIKTIEMIRKIREKQYNEIKEKNPEEIIKYFREKSLELRNEKKEIVKQT